MVNKKILKDLGSSLEAQVIGEGFEPGVLASVRIGNALRLAEIPNFCEDAAAGKEHLQELVGTMLTAKTVGGDWVAVIVGDAGLSITKPFASEAAAVAAALDFVAVK